MPVDQGALHVAREERGSQFLARRPPPSPLSVSAVVFALSLTPVPPPPLGKGSGEGAKLFALRGSRSSLLVLIPRPPLLPWGGGGARARSYSRFAQREARSWEPLWPPGASEPRQSGGCEAPGGPLLEPLPKKPFWSLPGDRGPWTLRPRRRPQRTAALRGGSGGSSGGIGPGRNKGSQLRASRCAKRE